MKYLHWTFCLFLLSLSVHSQRVFEEQARKVGIESLTRFKTFLALANDASKGDEIQDNISWVKEQLLDQGFEIKLLETSSLPLMIANLSIKEKLPTIALYMHLDGQAVDRSKWNQDDPYQAVIKQETASGFETLPWEALEGENIDELRIFARS